MPITSFSPKMLWRVRKPCISCESAEERIIFIPNVLLGTAPDWPPGSPSCVAVLSTSCCGIHVHLCPQLVLVSVTSEGLRISVQDNPCDLFNEKTEKNRTSALCSTPAWKLFPPFYNSKVNFPLGAAKKLKVTKSWQFTVPWRASQKAKWKWDCFHIRPLYLEGRIQTVWICSFTVHLGNPHKVQYCVFFSPSSQNNIKNTSWREL